MVTSYTALRMHIRQAYGSTVESLTKTRHEGKEALFVKVAPGVILSEDDVRDYGVVAKGEGYIWSLPDSQTLPERPLPSTLANCVIRLHNEGLEVLQQKEYRCTTPLEIAASINGALYCAEESKRLVANFDTIDIVLESNRQPELLKKVAYVQSKKDSSKIRLLFPRYYKRVQFTGTLRLKKAMELLVKAIGGVDIQEEWDEQFALTLPYSQLTATSPKDVWELLA